MEIKISLINCGGLFIGEVVSDTLDVIHMKNVLTFLQDKGGLQLADFPLCNEMFFNKALSQFRAIPCANLLTEYKKISVEKRSGLKLV